MIDFLIYAVLAYLIFGPIIGIYTFFMYIRQGAPFGMGVGYYFLGTSCIPIVNIPHLLASIKMIWYDSPMAEYLRRKTILKKRG